MHIPPASFRVTPYGEVDAKALDSLRASYETSQLINVVDRLDACLAEIGGIGSIRDDLLRLHAMALTVLDGAPLTIPTADVDSIWEEAERLQDELVALSSCLNATYEQLSALVELTPDYQS
ncbi:MULTISPECIES: Tn3 family transposase post-transcriptional regulator TnpC [unclassified Pseudomonas]|uniref:Tn3 family transposase post-transcriptional regulator TnpC n=1 Tax=unclassified Pseudomonas TaxID=196821 RepID=UPI000C868FF4|nr:MULTISPECIES: Tn3 family transposase post-transcriptional regulator TnpC [unclassified Pseudomonas]PMV97086.1 transposase [Pseudomonas sp. GW460-C8]PMW10114.1 transposase [Pseudomonas sp. GW456-11-11-14-TSB2]PMW21030.1 transposase [Pseudomonas sp. GW456-E6]PMW27592.1 transposase [Pseudomonas sp. FW305-3-2-15-A-R2A1]PMW36513.1 transposase [Pseudomonas sp. GW460-7]